MGKNGQSKEEIRTVIQTVAALSARIEESIEVKADIKGKKGTRKLYATISNDSELKLELSEHSENYGKSDYIVGKRNLNGIEIVFPEHCRERKY